MEQGSNSLYKLLGLYQIRQLKLAWQSRTTVACETPNSLVYTSILLSLLPALIVLSWNRALGPVPLSAIFAISTLAVYCSLKLNGISKKTELKKAFANIHTAFALGVVPFLVVMVISPDMLSELAFQKGHASPDAVPSQVGIFEVLGTILLIAIFTGATEELIFRGLLLRALRRWDWFKLLKSSESRDLAAILLSATIFAVAHLPFWGGAMSFAVLGIGLGLGLGFVVNGENVLVNCCYHCGFNFLSLLFSVLV